MKNATRKGLVAVAGVAALALTVTACSGSNGGSGSASAGGQVTIKISTFNNPGFGKSTAQKPGADLWTEYEKLHPNVKIVEDNAASSDDARNAFNTAMSSGTGAYDIQMADIDWMPSITAIADKFTDLAPYAKTANGDWLDWKTAQGTVDGKQIGLGTDIGPEGICFRSDLLSAAGLPSTRDAVATALGGKDATWQKYFDLGKQYVQASGGKAWFDSAAATYQGMVNQVQYSYVNKDGSTIDPSTNTTIKNLYTQVTTAAKDDKESAGLGQWTDAWGAAMKSDKFATMLCPAWIINNIKGNAGETFKGWDIADVFPGNPDVKNDQGQPATGGNWGGSFLVVPKQSKVADEAAKLAAWITAPAQQQKVFLAASNFPSSPTAQADPQVKGKTDPFLNNAPVGTIFASRAAAVNVVPFKGAKYFDIQTAMANALNRVDVDKSQSAADSWNQWVQDVKALG
ncbi:MAG: extracellular solute-binding protein [Promicromonosporaceae bacterium]|nr:extracellular solute-binding protein [Promicromonosporaceae bacterium]